MPYCTASGVRLVINTTLTDEEIDSVIEMSDAQIDRRIGAQSMTDPLIKKLSMLLTAQIIKTRQPQSYAVGEYREDSGNVLEIWEKEIEQIFHLYEYPTVREKARGIVKSTEYQHIDEKKRYPPGG